MAGVGGISAWIGLNCLVTGRELQVGVSAAEGQLARQFAVDAQRIDTGDNIDRPQRSALLVDKGNIGVGRSIILIEAAVGLPEDIRTVAFLRTAKER